DGQGRVTAGEDQAQPVIAHRADLVRLVAGEEQGGLQAAVLAERLPAESIDRPVAGGREDPARRTRRQPGRRPAVRRHGERVLDRVLGDVDVTEDADQDGHGATVLLTEDPADLGGGQVRHARDQLPTRSRNGRTSIGSVVARASRRPHSRAASRSVAWMIVNPPRCSLASAKGPSVVSTSPSWSRTTVAVL